MKFKYSANNERLIRRLNYVTESGRISHAYIFEGDSWLDKTEFAENFAKGILCHKGLGENCRECSICSKIEHGNCEDLLYVRAEDTGNVKDEAIELMQEKIKVKPYGSRHVCIIENADRMTARAQNRLLKTLEEPPGDSVILLLSENMENLAQTIRSRCVKFHINHLGSEQFDYMMETAVNVIEMVSDNTPFYRIMYEIKDFIRDKEKVKALLDGMEVTYRNMLVEGAGKVNAYRNEDIVNNIHMIERASEDIRYGVSAGTAVKNLIIKIGGKI